MEMGNINQIRGIIMDRLLSDTLDVQVTKMHFRSYACAWSLYFVVCIAHTHIQMTGTEHSLFFPPLQGSAVLDVCDTYELMRGVN